MEEHFLSEEKAQEGTDAVSQEVKDLGDKIIENPQYGLSEKEELHRQMRRKEFMNENS